jgi:hypothetical protein
VHLIHVTRRWRYHNNDDSSDVSPCVAELKLRANRNSEIDSLMNFDNAFISVTLILTWKSSCEAVAPLVFEYLQDLEDSPLVLLQIPLLAFPR